MYPGRITKKSHEGNLFETKIGRYEFTAWGKTFVKQSLFQPDAIDILLVIVLFNRYM